MKTISAIYRRVRHHLHDDWAYGNDLDAKPWDFQQQVCLCVSHVHVHVCVCGSVRGRKGE